MSSCPACSQLWVVVVVVVVLLRGPHEDWLEFGLTWAADTGHHAGTFYIYYGYIAC